jgi:chromosome segregation ATPase
VVLLALLAASAAAVEVKPFAKVVSLIEGLKAEVENEGKAEGKTYNEFACFCKSTTKKKSDSVIKGNDNINDLSADIADKTQQKKDDATEFTQRTQDQENLSKDLDDTTARCKQEKATYEAEEADLSKAVSSLKGAIKAMKDSKSAASLMQIKSVVQTISKTSAMSKTSVATKKAVTSLLQQRVDPDDPEYDFHSGDIISMCEGLLVDFKDQKKDLDSEWAKTDKGCTATKKSLRQEMTTNKQAMDALDKNIAKLAKEIAKHREDLVQADGDLKDDKLYLKDLTQRCEDRANDFDQRSKMRAGELDALTSALEVLTKQVKDADDVNKRALLQVRQAKPIEVSKPVQKVVAKVVAAKTSLSFLQVKQQNQNDLSLEAKKNRALSMLTSEGRRIGSVTIAALANRVQGDPFKKIQGLIQKLIERLLKESAAEATKKGFCDTELAKAEHNRDARFEEANDLSRAIAALEAKEDELVEEIKVLTKDIKDEKADLKQATEDRDQEKKDNMEALKVAKDGLAGVGEALQILKGFYSQAAKASAAFLQASPVDEDTAGAASGSYNGKQGSMKAIFGLLEVIQSDFDRTIRTTESSENKAHREYIAFMQASESSIAGKTTKKELDEEDLKTTRTSLDEKMSDLQANMDLLDSALKELEDLKPQCIDTGMSYAERVKKREEEMAALKKALCILDTDKVESECQ